MTDLSYAPILVLKSTETYPTLAANGMVLQEGTRAVKVTASGTEWKIYNSVTDAWVAFALPVATAS